MISHSSRSAPCKVCRNMLFSVAPTNDRQRHQETELRHGSIMIRQIIAGVQNCCRSFARVASLALAGHRLAANLALRLMYWQLIDLAYVLCRWRAALIAVPASLLFIVLLATYVPIVSLTRWMRELFEQFSTIKLTRQTHELLEQFNAITTNIATGFIPELLLHMDYWLTKRGIRPKARPPLYWITFVSSLLPQHSDRHRDLRSLYR